MSVTDEYILVAERRIAATAAEKSVADERRIAAQGDRVVRGIAVIGIPADRGRPQAAFGRGLPSVTLEMYGCFELLFRKTGRV